MSLCVLCIVLTLLLTTFTLYKRSQFLTNCFKSPQMPFLKFLTTLLIYSTFPFFISQNSSFAKLFKLPLYMNAVINTLALHFLAATEQLHMPQQSNYILIGYAQEVVQVRQNSFSALPFMSVSLKKGHLITLKAVVL